MNNDFEDDVTYCVYCYNEVPEDKQYKGCCGEVHFATGKDLNDREKELELIDKQMIFMHQEKQYDPPMTQTEEYLLKKQREEEYKSYEY